MLQQPHRAEGRGQSGTARLWPLVRNLKRDQRGSILIITALVTPVLAMAIGIGIEVSHWTVVKLELQRTADIAALAGATEYALVSTAGNTGTAESAAANAAANVAELNGAAGGTTRTWNASEKRLRNNHVTVLVTNGVRRTENTALEVTVSQEVPLLLTRTMSTSTSVTINAVGKAELLQSTTQPCLLALSAGGAGVSAQGNPSLTMEGCSVRSNASISAGGSATMSAEAFHAGGSISDRGISGARHPNSGMIADPYATHPAVQAAFRKLSSGSGLPINDKPKATLILDSRLLNTWSSWDIKGTVILGPGIYYVNGDIQLGSQASLSGTGVTIVMLGSLKVTGGGSMTLSAAEKGKAQNGAIPGVVFAGNSTAASSFHGNTEQLLTGVVYYPRGELTFAGNPQAGSEKCLEVLAAAVVLKGNSSLAAKCDRYGTEKFSSGGAPAVTLVQ